MQSFSRGFLRQPWCFRGVPENFNGIAGVSSGAIWRLKRFQGRSRSFNNVPGISEAFQGVFKRFYEHFRGFQESSRGDSESLEACFKGFLVRSRGFIEFEGVQERYKDFRGASGTFVLFLQHHKEFQGRSKGFQGF